MASFIDPSGRGPAVATLAIRGLCYLAVVAVATSLLVLQSRGAFRDDLRATAVVSGVGDGLPAGSDVKLRDVLVGSVASVDSVPGGTRHVVHLDLRRGHAPRIPSSVRARILPTNVFGAPYVQLVPGEGSAAPLAEGAVIPGDNSKEAVRLQTAMTKVRDILAAVEPAKLNSALTAMAEALDGRGAQAGALLDRLDSYLAALVPHSATFGHNLSTLATALEGLQGTAPKLLDTVDSALVTARTVVAKQQQLARTLAGGATTVDTVRGLIEDNADRLIQVVRDTAPVVREVAADAEQIPLSFQALGRGVDAFGNAFGGPHDWLTLDLVFTFTPFTPYTSGDCPRYGELPGPNCDDPPAPQPDPIPLPPSTPSQQAQPEERAPTPAPAPQGGLVGPVGSEQETDALAEVFGEGVRDFGALGNLLLGPFVRGATVVPR